MGDQERLVGRDAELAVLEAEWQRASTRELRAAAERERSGTAGQ